MKDVLGNEDARQAALKEIESLIAKFAISGSAGAFGYGALQKSLDAMTATNSTLAAIGFGVSGYVLAKGAGANLWGYAKNLPGACSTTFGNGNAEWAA